MNLYNLHTNPKELLYSDKDLKLDKVAWVGSTLTDLLKAKTGQDVYDVYEEWDEKIMMLGTDNDNWDGWGFDQAALYYGKLIPSLANALKEWIKILDKHPDPDLQWLWIIDYATRITGERWLEMEKYIPSFDDQPKWMHKYITNYYDAFNIPR